MAWAQLSWKIRGHISSRSIKREAGQFPPGENPDSPGKSNTARINQRGLTGRHASLLTSSLTKGEHRKHRKGARGFLREHKYNCSQRPIFSMVCSRVIHKPQTSINEPLTCLLALLSVPHSALITRCLRSILDIEVCHPLSCLPDSSFHEQDTHNLI